MPRPDDFMDDGIVEDLATHPDTTWAVIWQRQLLPARFARASEAAGHLRDLRGDNEEKETIA